MPWVSGHPCNLSRVPAAPHLQRRLNLVPGGLRLPVAAVRQRHLRVRREGVRKVVDIALARAAHAPR